MRITLRPFSIDPLRRIIPLRCTMESAASVRGAAMPPNTLAAAVVMTNDVHMLITPHKQVPTLLRRLKGSTAWEANKLLAGLGRLSGKSIATPSGVGR